MRRVSSMKGCLIRSANLFRRLDSDNPCAEGKDIGVVMAKGVIFGVITCITILPALILTFDKAIIAIPILKRKKTGTKKDGMLIPSTRTERATAISTYKGVSFSDNALVSVTIADIPLTNTCLSASPRIFFGLGLCEYQGQL